MSSIMAMHAHLLKTINDSEHVNNPTPILAPIEETLHEATSTYIHNFKAD